MTEPTPPAQPETRPPWPPATAESTVTPEPAAPSADPIAGTAGTAPEGGHADSVNTATSVENAPAATIPAQPPAGQPYPGQSYPGQPYAGQPYAGQVAPAQTYPGQQIPTQPTPGQPVTAPPYPGQPMSAQPYSSQPYPGQPVPGQPYPSQPYPGQPYPSQPYPGQPYPSQPYPGQPYPGSPLPGQPPVSGVPAPGYWPGADVPAPPKKKRRTGLIVTIVLIVVLVLCGGVGATAYIVSTGQTGTGQTTPQDAATKFLTAVYVHQNPTEAAKYVCTQANDARSISKKINEIKSQAGKLDNPAYQWSQLDVSHQTTKEATVSTVITLTTDDEKSATQKIALTTVNNHGWWVCDVNTSAN